MTISELYYLGSLLEKELLRDSFENKKQLAVLNTKVTESKMNMEDFQAVLDQIVGAHAALKLNSTIQIEDRVMESYEFLYYHQIATRVSVDLNVRLVYLMKVNNIDSNILSPLQGKAIKFILENVPQGSRWEKFVEVIEGISSKDILRWIDELKNEGLIVKASSPIDDLGKNAIISGWLIERYKSSRLSNLGVEEIGDKDAAVLNDDSVGGIDLNPNILEIETQGIKLNLNYSVDPTIIDNRNLEGLFPVIINISPVTNIPFLLGESQEQSDDFSLSQLN